MADVRELRRDLGVFAQAIGAPLANWQVDALRLERRTSVIVAPRQSGKSRSLSVLALWWAFRQSEQRVLIVSAGEEAARRLLASASSIAVRSGLLAGSVVDENAGLLALSNGSEVRSVPASERQVRGWSVDLLLVDECALVDDELLLGAALPTTAARPLARVVLAGSPAAPEGAFFDFARSGEQESEHTRTFRWSLRDASWIASEVVAGAREQLAPTQFVREFEGEFADVGADERVIDRAWIEAAQQRTLEAAGLVVYGLDVARRGGDESVLVRVHGGRARVAFSVRGLDLMQLAARTAAEVGSSTVAVDAIGLGFGVLDRLRQMKVNAVEFVASSRATDSRRHLNLRAQAWWQARELLRGGALDLDPADKMLAAQLAGVRYRLAPSGAIQIEGKEQMRTSPDRADALVVALWAAQVGGGWGLMSAVAGWRRRQVAEADPLLRPEGEVSPLGLWREARSDGLTVIDEVVDRDVVDLGAGDDLMRMEW